MIKRIIAIAISILMLTFSFTGCIPRHEHEFGNWEVYTPAKCTETGLPLENRFRLSAAYSPGEKKYRSHSL